MSFIQTYIGAKFDFAAPCAEAINIADNRPPRIRFAGRGGAAVHGAGLRNEDVTLPPTKSETHALQNPSTGLVVEAVTPLEYSAKVAAWAERSVFVGKIVQVSCIRNSTGNRIPLFGFRT